MIDFFLFTTYFQIARELLVVGFCLKTRKNGEIRAVASNGKTEALAPVNFFFVSGVYSHQAWTFTLS